MCAPISHRSGRQLFKGIARVEQGFGIGQAAGGTAAQQGLLEGGAGLIGMVMAAQAGQLAQCILFAQIAGGEIGEQGASGGTTQPVKEISIHRGSLTRRSGPCADGTWYNAGGVDGTNEEAP